MTIENTKAALYRLIDSIDDESKLQKAYQVLESISEVNEPGNLWNKLSKEQKQELEVIEKESHNENRLIDHEEVKNKHQKWL